MISGIFLRNKNQTVDPDWLTTVVAPSDGNTKKYQIFCDGPIGFSYYPQLDTRSNTTSKPFSSKTKDLAIVFTGKIYNAAELEGAVGTNAYINDLQNSSSLVLNLYKKLRNLVPIASSISILRVDVSD